jgi:hypothetical protein
MEQALHLKGGSLGQNPDPNADWGHVLKPWKFDAKPMKARSLQTAVFLINKIKLFFFKINK